MAKSWERIKSELAEPFSSEDVEWRLQNVSKDKTRGLAVAYVTARAIQNRLDEVVGPENWQDEYILTIAAVLSLTLTAQSDSQY